MQVRIYKPHLGLQEFVVSISTIEAELPPGMAEAVSPYPPTPFQSLIFYCNNPVSMSKFGDVQFQQQADTVLVGPQYSRVNIKVHQRLASVRVDFYPGGMFRLLGIPMHEIFDTGLNATDIFGPEMNELNEKLKNTAFLSVGKDLVEDFLLRKLSGLKSKLPFDHSMKILFQNSGNISMEEAASLACLSLKQFERKSVERLGMNPKTFARILKFSKAYRMREAFPELTWTEIAVLAGYFDQMHMIRDFKTFAGVNPSVIASQIASTSIRMQKDLPN